MAAEYGIPLAIGTVGTWIVGTMFSKDPYSQDPYYSSSYGSNQYSGPSSSWFGSNQYSAPSSSWFGPSEPQRPSSSWFGPSEPQRPSSSWFGPSEPQRPSSSWFGTSEPQRPSSSWFGTKQPAPPVESKPSTTPTTPEPTPTTPEPVPEPTPGFQSISAWTDSECMEYLTKFKITDKQSFRRWMVRNHPDRGGDGQIFANVSACFKRMIPQDPPSTGPSTPPNTAQNEPDIPSNPYPSNGPNIPADEPDTQPIGLAETPRNRLDIRSDQYRPNGPSNEPDTPTTGVNSDSPPETTTEDCRNPNLYFENTAGGDCLFESLAQIYHPVDIRSRDSAAYQPVLDTATKLRLKLAGAYRDASKSNLFRTSFSIPKSITNIDDRVMTLAEYASFISIPLTWATDTDLEIMSRLLKIPFRVIEHSDEGETLVRNISGPGVSPSEDEYYTICNIDNRHWVLKKHNRPLTGPNL